MNDFLNAVTRWTVRLVLLAVGVVFFLSLLTVACILAAVWAMRGAASWASMAQRAGGFGGMRGAAADSSEEASDAAPFTPAAGSKRGGILPKMANDVSDVQPREVR